MKILAIAGSLRRASYNRALVEAARAVARAPLRIDTFDLDDIPLYNADFDVDELRPPEVDRLKRELTAADGLLISTPEYNHSVPGVLQNAIDWVSRPAMRSPLVGKPVAIMSAATGAIGGARAQQQLKLALLSTMALLMPHPGVVVGMAQEKFDASNELVHDPTRRFLATFVRDFGEWMERMTRSADAANASRVS
jgi:chromate reductase